MFTRTDLIKVLNQRPTWAVRVIEPLRERAKDWDGDVSNSDMGLFWVHCLGPSFPRKVVIASTMSPKQFRNTAQHKTAWIHAQQQKGQ